MKKLLTLLLVSSFAFSVSAVTHVPEKKAEIFLIEKSFVKMDLTSVEVHGSAIESLNKKGVSFLVQHRFRKGVSFNSNKTKFICGIYPDEDAANSKLPDKNI